MSAIHSEFYKSVINSSDDAIICKSLDGTVLTWNPAAERIFGYKAEEMIGQKLIKIFPPDRLQEEDLILEKIKKGERISNFETVRTHKDGSTIKISVTISPLTNHTTGVIVGAFKIARNITSQVEARSRETLSRFAMDNVCVEILWLDRDAKIIYANKFACASLGYTFEEITQISISDVDPFFPLAEWSKHWEELKRDKTQYFESVHRRKDGSLFPVEITANFIQLDDHEFNIGFARDISERKEAEEKLKIANIAYESAAEAILITDEMNSIISVNPAFTHITGYSIEEVIGKTPAILKSGKQGKEFYQAMWHELLTTGKWSGEIWNRRKNGEVYAEQLAISTLFNDDGTAFRRIGVFSDITERKKNEAIIWEHASYDSLTGAYNRRMIHTLLEAEIKKSQRNGSRITVMYVDIDRFKEINDSHGHDCGDFLLKEAVKRMMRIIRESDFIGRLGGDEFLIVLPGLDNSESLDRIARGILVELSSPFHIGKEDVTVSASIGIAIYPNDANTDEGLLNKADKAMYCAKTKGRNQFCYSSSSLN